MVNAKTDSRIKLIFFLAGMPFLYFILTGEQTNWIYYTSVSLIFLGIIYSLLSDWIKGKKNRVKTRLFAYAGIIFLLVVIGLFKNN
jgi:hypothetical protein